MKKIMIILLLLLVCGVGGFFGVRFLLKGKEVPPPPVWMPPSQAAMEGELRRKGEVMYKRQYYAPMIALYHRLLLKNPQDLEIKKKLGLAYFGAENWKASRQFLEEVQKEKPNDVEVKDYLQKIPQ